MVDLVPFPDKEIKARLRKLFLDEKAQQTETKERKLESEPVLEIPRFFVKVRLRLALALRRGPTIGGPLPIVAVFTRVSQRRCGVACDWCFVSWSGSS
jgi:hypothetical protein